MNTGLLIFGDLLLLGIGFAGGVLAMVLFAIVAAARAPMPRPGDEEENGS